jgi:hypothetical protein
MYTRIVPVLALLGLTASGAGAEELPFLASQSEYSATRIIETNEGDFEQKVNWTPDKVRTETSLGGVTLLNIVRDDLGVMWIANPMLGRCLEQPVETIDEMTQLGGQYAADQVTWKELGKETVDGLETTKYEVSADDAEIGPHKAYMWSTPENILVRMEMETVAQGTELKFTMRLVELELGDQDDALFESPGDCISMEDLGQP